jgi:hypothetical protein
MDRPASSTGVVSGTPRPHLDSVVFPPCRLECQSQRRKKTAIQSIMGVSGPRPAISAQGIPLCCKLRSAGLKSVLWSLAARLVRQSIHGGKAWQFGTGLHQLKEAPGISDRVLPPQGYSSVYDPRSITSRTERWLRCSQPSAQSTPRIPRAWGVA